MKDQDFYADFDTETQSWGVFGTETGFCYTTRSSQQEAEDLAREMRTT